MNGALASGSPSHPIVFEAESAPNVTAANQPQERGKWGGIIVLGEGRVSMFDYLAPGTLKESIQYGSSGTPEEQAWANLYMPNPPADANRPKPNETFVKATMRDEVWPPSPLLQVYLKPNVCGDGVHLDCDNPGYDPEHVQSGRLTYGGYRDEGSCGRLEYVQVLNAGGGSPQMNALGRAAVLSRNTFSLNLRLDRGKYALSIGCERVKTDELRRD